MNVGQDIVVICSRADYGCNELPFPPVGSVGVITKGLDECGEYEIHVPTYLCPTVNDPDWITHKTMIAPIDKVASDESTYEYLEPVDLSAHVGYLTSV